MLVLGFDTATPAVSVALHDGERVIAAASALDARRHSELLTPMIAKIMADAGASRADLTAIAVGVGPGPYTGLRVGVVTARVLGSVLRLPVSGVCSLDVIAASAAAASPARPVPGRHRRPAQGGLLGPLRRRRPPRGRPPRGTGQCHPGCRRPARGGRRRPAVPGGVRRADRARLPRRRHAVRPRRPARPARSRCWPRSRCTCAAPTPASPGRPSGSRRASPGGRPRRTAPVTRP